MARARSACGDADARDMPPADVFAAVSDEIGRILYLDIATMNRFESDGTMTVVASCNDQPTTGWPVSSTWAVERDSVSGQMFRPSRPARVDDRRRGVGQAGRPRADMAGARPSVRQSSSMTGSGRGDRRLDRAMQIERRDGPLHRSIKDDGAVAPTPPAARG